MPEAGLRPYLQAMDIRININGRPPSPGGAREVPWINIVIERL